MEDIKLWQLEGSRATPLASNNRLESEHLLEETLVENPDLLIDGLTLVGRQTPTEGGPLDLLGVDPNGRLVVFELKRGTLSRDAVAQVIDYASHLDDMDLGDLAAHIASASGAHGIDRIDDFEEWYGRKYREDLELLKPLRLFLVGLGVDERTERMVRFLAVNSEMEISLLTFHGFDQGGKTLLAKQVEVSATEEARPTRRRRHRTKAEYQAILDRKLRESEVADLFAEVLTAWDAVWSSPGKAPGVFGLRLRLGNPRTGGYATLARLEPWSREVAMVFYSEAIRLCREEFRPFVEGDDAIPHETSPMNQAPVSDPQPEIKLKVSRDVWSAHQTRLTALLQSVYEAWHDLEEDDDSP